MRSHCHCFFPKSVIFLFYYFSVRFCHSRKEENILETSHLPFVTKTWAPPPKQPPQTRRQAAGEDMMSHGDQDLARDPSVGDTQLEPGQQGGLSLWGHPYPNTFSQAISRTIQKVTKLSFQYSLDTRSCPSPPRCPGEESSRDPRALKFGFPTTYLKLLLTAVFRGAPDTPKSFRIIHFGS